MSTPGDAPPVINLAGELLVGRRWAGSIWHLDDGTAAHVVRCQWSRSSPATIDWRAGGVGPIQTTPITELWPRAKAILPKPGAPIAETEPAAEPPPPALPPAEDAGLDWLQPSLI